MLVDSSPRWNDIFIAVLISNLLDASSFDMITNHTFDHLFLLGRPASGKSEFIDFMKNQDEATRRRHFFIGDMDFVDDFVWLWEKFEDDNIWEKVIGKRLHSKRSEHAYILDDAALFDFLIEKFNDQISKQYLSNPNFYEKGSLIIEFARGGEKPYTTAFDRFDSDIFKKAAIIYVQVSGDESRRRNEARYQEKLKDSILAHKVPDEDMNRFYADDDWNDLTKGEERGFLDIRGVKVPFVTMNNEPESKDEKVLSDRYGKALGKLYEICI